MEPGCASPSDIDDGLVIELARKAGFRPRAALRDGQGRDGRQARQCRFDVVVRHGVLIYDITSPTRTNSPLPRPSGTWKFNDQERRSRFCSELLSIAAGSRTSTRRFFHISPNMPISARLRRIASPCAHLLTMSAGLEWHEIDTPYSEPANAPISCFTARSLPLLLKQKVIAPAGKIPNYNSGTSKVIIAILTKVTGKALDELARTQLFEPLGIKDVSWSGHGSRAAPATGRKSASWS